MIAALLAQSASAWSAAAQATVVISEDVGCECRLDVERVTRLSDPDGRAGLSSPLVIERISEGRYLVVPATQQGTILLFNSSGRYERSIGRVGQGPGEFRAVVAIRTGLADSTVLMDGGNRRLAVLDPALAPSRTARVPVMSAWFGILEDGSVAILTGIPRAGSPQDRVHVFSPRMEPIRSFMSAGQVAFGDPAEPPRRRMSVSKDGVVVVGHHDQYVLEIWTAAGQHVATLQRDPDWFRLNPALRSDGDPSPRLETPRIGADGRIWTVSHVPDRYWRAALDTVRDMYGRRVMGVPEGAQNRSWDSVIELINPKTRVLLGSVRMDARVTLISDDGFAADYHQDEAGNPYIDVWRLTLVRGPARR
jgi:hypothetical protein